MKIQKKQSEQKLFESERRYFNPILYVLGIILFSWLGFGIDSLAENQNEVIETIFTLVFSFGIFACIREILLLKKIVFYTDKFEVKDYLGFRKRTIFYKDISNWVLEERSNKHTSWEQLLVWFSNGDRIKLYSTDYTNFDEIYHKISIQKSENQNLKSKRECISTIRLSLFFVGAGIFMLFVSYYENSKLFSLSSKDIVQVEGRLHSPIEKVRYKGRVSKMILKLEEFPNHKFVVVSSIINSKNISNLDELQVGNNLKFSILKSEIEGKDNLQVDIVELPNYFTSFDYEKFENERLRFNRNLCLIVGVIILLVSLFIFKSYLNSK